MNAGKFKYSTRKISFSGNPPYELDTLKRIYIICMYFILLTRTERSPLNVYTNNIHNLQCQIAVQNDNNKNNYSSNRFQVRSGQ